MREILSHTVESSLIFQSLRCRFLLDHVGHEPDAAHVYHHERDHAGVDLELVLD